MRDTEALGAGDPGALEDLWSGASEQGARVALAEAYRRWGWRAADLDPLGLRAPASVLELDPEIYGLTAEDAAPLAATYCGSIGWEFGHIQDSVRRNWLSTRAESGQRPSAGDRTRALDLIARGEHFEATCDRRLPGAKTFGLSGAESYLVLLDCVLRAGVVQGAERVVIGGMHRGRLTQMALTFGKPLAQVIAEARGTPALPESLGASSDSPYHLGWEGKVEIEGQDVDVWIAPHPSHLSIVAPVGMGFARAAIKAGASVLPLSLHTDAAFAGQGVNAELLQLSGLAPFTVGGTIHLILNNQIGFTTDGEEGRTARTAADFAKVIEAPILHVNGDDPDAVLSAAETAVAYRQAFGADVVVDLIAYRRKGHNEIDQPRFTQPDMYRAIDALAPLSERYGSELGQNAEIDDFARDLDAAFEASGTWRSNSVPAAPGLAPGIEKQMLSPVQTGMEPEALRSLGTKLIDVPCGLTVHPKVTAFLDARREATNTGHGIDWATAEALALASLADTDVPVRLGGQDSVRGAFTQRHLRIHCQHGGRTHDVLSRFAAPPQIHDTPLTENAVLGFEYGYSVGRPDGLTIWEAQFGDFLNVAQPIFDQFITCGEDRWLFRSNLVMLLPHGLDGGGPDHATARPERLLAACAKGNIQVVNPSTPANYFHALRRQVFAQWRKPLVVLAPKALLRHPGARSALPEFDGRFQTVLKPRKRPARRVVLSTGKLAVLLEQARDKAGTTDVALIRLEQLYPLDRAALRRALKPYPDAELIWAQEEPENMGYFLWLDRRLEEIAGRRWRLVSRPASPSAASGPKPWDDAHLDAVIATALDLEN